MASFFERYKAGEHEQVWAELVQLGDQVRTEPLLADALAVARETMTRARANVERLLDRLDSIEFDFRFARTSDDRSDLVTFMPPAANVHEQLAELERLAGTLPLSLYAWWEVVGAVALWGDCSHWDPGVLSDPLHVVSIEFALQDYQSLMKTTMDRSISQTYDVEIGADDYHKAEFSGGPMIAIEVPCLAADATLLHWWGEATFVEYLRACFRWGGFPGFERYADYPKKDIDFLAAELLPI